MNRIEHLRQKALKDMPVYPEFYYHFYKSYESLSDLSENLRYTEAFFYAFSNTTPSISEGELIVGKYDDTLSAEAEKEWLEIYKPIARENRSMVGQDSHMTIDYELLLTSGINGILEKIDSYMKQHADDPEKITFYNTCKRCLEAVVVHSEKYAQTAFELSQTATDPNRKAELLQISKICKKVPANPAETFHEALQAVHFITHCIFPNPYRMEYQQFQLGHPDRYLLPYYEKDLKEGRITKQDAQLLLDCFGIQINMRVPNGLSSGYMVGGRDADGNIVANDLTEMCMQVIEDIHLVYPAVGFCYTEGMPEQFLKKACDILAKGFSHPAIFNDDIITKGLKYYGVPDREAHNYIHSTCVEITPVASSNVWVASPYTNMPQLLLDSMDREYANFEELLESVFAKLDERIKNNYLTQKNYRQIRAEKSQNPLLSCFVNDCLEKGTDIEEGGARYNWITPSFVGMANLVDALYTIKELVFKKSRLTIAEFKEILQQNFEGNEALRNYILHHIPKYGNDNDDIDQYFGMFTEHIIKECQQLSDGDEEKLIPSVFCWIMHEQFGRETGATPDGRTAGFPLGDGSGPCQGREMQGPTASIISSTKWEHHKLIGGVAVNLKFSKASLGNHSTDVMLALVKTYLSRGGFEVQINVIDNETLKKARIHPDEYRDLVVRIGGYSDYFVKLSPEMQEEVILRTTHQI